MRTLLIATASVFALLAGQALAQSAGSSPAPSDQTTQQSPAGGDSANQAGSSVRGSAGADQSAAAPQDSSQVQASDLLGKKVKLQGKDESVGEITDVVVINGKPQQAVIDMGSKRDKPVAVSVTQLSPSGEDFILSMSEEELAQAPDYEPGQQPSAGGATRGLQNQQQAPGSSSEYPTGQPPSQAPSGQGSGQSQPSR